MTPKPKTGRNMADCPEFANDQIPADLPALERHAEECEHCRAKLEHIVRQQIGDLPSDVHELARFATPGAAAPQPSVKAPASLQFQPPHEPSRPVHGALGGSSPSLATTSDRDQASNGIAASTAEELNRRLPQFHVEAELGRGGMGVVYKAQHLKFQRLVALKMILAGDHASAQQTERFLTEARAVARLQNPHIVQIYEIGEYNGLPYFSLEYLDGGSLAAKLKGLPPSDMEAARLVELLALAVHYAHGRGIVHRDLKPANILLTGEGIPKIADFGLAKFLSEDSGTTRTGVILGTPSYMAPEQAIGKAKDIGPAVDIYALGAILYELLTGRPPFRGESIQETLRSVEEQAPEPPRVHNPRVDRALEAICLKCLEKAPRDRYPSAEALAEDLAAYIRGEPVRADQGTASRLFGAVLRETRYTEVMTLWSGVWMGIAVAYFLICLAKSLLVWFGVQSHGPYFGIWVAMCLTVVGLFWFYRFRSGPRLSQVERQSLQILCFFWIGFFLTAWQYHRVGAPIVGLPSILVLELAVAMGCIAALLGSSFYVMAAACVFTAVLEALWPQAGPLISGVFCSPALFWVGWKYSRRWPPH
jgi:serine/threonine-protein kinase